MATEDLTTYNEVDVSGDLTVTASRVTFASMLKTAEAHLSDDKGAAFFSGDFTFRCKFTSTDEEPNSTFFFLGLSNTLDSFQPIDDASGDEQVIEVYGTNPDFTLYVVDLDGGTFNNASALAGLLDNGTVYYVEFKRDESVGTYGEITVTVWTVDYEDTLFGTRSLLLSSSKKDFRYVYAIQSKQGSSGANNSSGNIDAVDLDAGAAGIANPWYQYSQQLAGAM